MNCLVRLHCGYTHVRPPREASAGLPVSNIQCANRLPYTALTTTPHARCPKPDRVNAKSDQVEANTCTHNDTLYHMPGCLRSLSSFAMVYQIPDAELSFRATRSGGPGGQHVNQSSTRVEVRWQVTTSPSLTDEQRERLLEKLSSRIDSRGFLRVVAEEHRSQLRNREAAVTRLNELVRSALKKPKPRKKTKPSAAAKRKRLEAKRQRSIQKQQRRPVDRDAC